jgi:hypothetical protein
MPAGIAAFRLSGVALHMPLWISSLAKAYADVGPFDHAWRCIAEAITVADTTKEKWCNPQTEWQLYVDSGRRWTTFECQMAKKPPECGEVWSSAPRGESAGQGNPARFLDG